MNYQKIYNQLVQKRQVIPVVGYKEVHHIVPKCMHGSNNKSNLVGLTAREHYIAHVLLWKINIGTQYEDSLLSAVTMMQCKNNINDRDFKFNSKLYENIRLKFSEIRRLKILNRTPEEKEILHKKLSLAQSGKNNGMFGKKMKELMSDEDMKSMYRKMGNTMKTLVFIVNLTTGKTKRIKKGSQIPNGWRLGRFLNPSNNPRFNPNKKQKKIKIRNPKTRECITIQIGQVIPDGWERGWYYTRTSKVKSIRNPKTKQNKWIHDSEPIPDGWEPGMYIDQTYRNRKRSNEDINIEHEHRSSSVIGEKNPCYNKKLICNINLGIQKYIQKDQSIPDGWLLGSLNKHLRQKQA